jgi:plastocyanin
VLADDGSFTSGPLGTDWSTFSHTFDTAGEFGYFCEAHGAAGGTGMAGKVIVVGPQTRPQVYLPLLSH